MGGQRREGGIMVDTMQQGHIRTTTQISLQKTLWI